MRQIYFKNILPHYINFLETKFLSEHSAYIRNMNNFHIK